MKNQFTLPGLGIIFLFLSTSCKQNIDIQIAEIPDHPQVWQMINIKKEILQDSLYLNYCQQQLDKAVLSNNGDSIRKMTLRLATVQAKIDVYKEKYQQILDQDEKNELEQFSYFLERLTIREGATLGTGWVVLNKMYNAKTIKEMQTVLYALGKDTRTSVLLAKNSASILNKKTFRKTLKKVFAVVIAYEAYAAWRDAYGT